MRRHPWNAPVCYAVTDAVFIDVWRFLLGVQQRIPIIDGHNDTLLRLFGRGTGEAKAFFERGAEGHIDMVRAREGGFAGGFFAVFVPQSLTEKGTDASKVILKENGYEVPLPPALDRPYAQSVALQIMAGLFKLERESRGGVCVIRTVRDIEDCIERGVMAAILHMEGSEAIDEDLNALEVFYQAGLRSLGIVWSRPTAFGFGVPMSFPMFPDTGPGLTDAGKRLVRQCNELGIMIDLSHLNERGFWDVAEISDAPLVATHSNVHALSNSPRNLTDKQLDAIRDSDGMVGLNFSVTFLREDGYRDADTPIDLMVRHINYLVERLGIERVGLGSDFDGAMMPRDIGDVSGLPRLMDALRQSGYDDDSLRKIGYQNWIRVLSKTWKE